jgi:uncharacterized membrane protein
MKKNAFLKLLLIIFVLLLTISVFSGCRKVSFIPGASFGYYIWEENGIIHISWSIDRKDASFSGSIRTDGEIGDIELIAWEESDGYEAGVNTISYTSTLGVEDYTDGIIIEITGHDYIEFDLRIDDGYDLSRVHVGAFLNNPESSPFRIGPDYFDEVRSIPWYEKHPFSGFFNKLFANRYFTFLFLFVIGAVVIEIIRITVFSGKKSRKLYTGISYIVLICLEIVIYFILRSLVL